MSVFRINKTRDFITMGKFHFREKDMSLKAIGMLSLMLSLPEDWDYSVEGLTSIRNESKNTINAILNELEKFGYLERKRIYKDGKITDWEYNIFEQPNLHPKNQDLENLDIENQDLKNCTQLNNKELNNKKVNKKEYFKKPTIEEIETYCKERNNGVDANRFYYFYESKNWMIGKNKMKDWKAAVITWERNKKSNPKWMNEEHTKETISEAEENLLNDLLKNFK